MKLLVGRSKLSVSAAVIFQEIAAGNRKSATVRGKESRSCFMRLSSLELLGQSKRELSGALELAECAAFVPVVLKDSAVCLYFGRVWRADFVRSRIYVKFAQNRVAKIADNGYKKRRPDFA